MKRFVQLTPFWYVFQTPISLITEKTPFEEQLLKLIPQCLLWMFILVIITIFVSREALPNLRISGGEAMGRKYFEIYKILLRQNLKMKLEFRTDFYISSLALIIVNIFSCFSTVILFSQTKEIGNFNKDQISMHYT